MAEDIFRVTLDTAGLLSALDRLGREAERHLVAAAHVTATNVQSEAQRRVARATGETMRGIVVREGAGHQPGWAVLATNPRMPNLPLWIEKGTKQGKPGSHTAPARPFFYTSVDLEAGAHDRRMREALQDAIDEQGLGA